MSPEERADDFRQHLRLDFARKITPLLGQEMDTDTSLTLLEELVHDAMFYIEHLVVEAGETSDA